MKEITIENWDAFQTELTKLEDFREECRNSSDSHVSELLFRGVSDSSWKLETTLERETNREVPIREYLELVRSLKPEIETYASKVWEIPDLQELENSLSEQRPSPIVAYEYMAYLRHHGFPSPLLDWTSSPLIAAYFAFAKNKKVESVSIYAYLERVGYGKSGGGTKPQIFSLGHAIRAHVRHFLQRSQYTLCFKKISAKEHVFCAHEGAFQGYADKQDLLWKFIIPMSEQNGSGTVRPFQCICVLAFSVRREFDGILGCSRICCPRLEVLAHGIYLIHSQSKCLDYSRKRLLAPLSLR